MAPVSNGWASRRNASFDPPYDRKSHRAAGSAWLLCVGIALAMIGTACDSGKRETTNAPTDPPPIVSAHSTSTPSPLVFRAEELPFHYERGDSGSAWPVEPTGGGVGLLDYDGDGDLDLFFVQGVPLPVGSSKNPPADCLLRNDGGGKFVDASAQAGLTSKGYGQGVTVGDYDGDGDPDAYVTRYGRSTLWRNDGSKFADATADAGVGCGRWSLGAAFLDYDRDGDLDLFVTNYFDFDPAAAPFARDEAGQAQYAMPANFPGQPDALYRNDGNGHFTDVTSQAGIAGQGRGMGCLASDFDGDGFMDILVANDAEPNILWRNRGNGTFEEVAGEWGIAVNGQGLPEANMGIANGDSNGDTTPDVAITHFFGEHTTLWRSMTLGDGRIAFQDQTFEAGVGVDSQPVTGWGIAFADFDLDGHLDLIQTNGHIRREASQLYPYENPALIWRNGGDGRFTNVSATAGPYFTGKHIGRGLAVGDLDGDGDLDVVVVHHHARSVVLWNETPNQGRALRVALRGAGANRTAIGTRLTARIGKQTLIRSIDGGGSYLSSNEPECTFGLGSARQVDSLEIRWPSGRAETRSNLAADGKLVRIDEKNDGEKTNRHGAAAKDHE